MVIPFRNPPTTNYRALRDMGLAAWWGSSLMNLAGLIPAAKSRQDPEEALRIHDAGLKGSRGLQAGAVAAYLFGTSLARFDGKPFDSGKPRWISEGVESIPRTAATVVALAAGVGGKIMRQKAIEAYSERRDGDEGESLRKQAHMMHAIIPAATGWLMYSHLKEDMRETQSPVRRLFGLI